MSLLRLSVPVPCDTRPPPPGTPGPSLVSSLGPAAPGAQGARSSGSGSGPEGWRPAQPPRCCSSVPRVSPSVPTWGTSAQTSPPLLALSFREGARSRAIADLLGALGRFSDSRVRNLELTEVKRRTLGWTPRQSSLAEKFVGPGSSASPRRGHTCPC